MVRRVGLIVAAAIVMGVWAAPAGAAPEDFGNHEVRVTRVSVPVAPDPRGPEGVLPTVAADVYVPAGPGGPWPLVQLSHAWPGTLAEFPLSGWAKRLASRGFVVVVSDRRGGSNLALAPPLDQPSDLVDLGSPYVHAEDILTVLRWAIANEPVDRTRIAIGGHSLGAYHATFAAVMSQTEGPRLSALLLLDPSDARLGTLTKDSSLPQTPQVKVPTMVLISEENEHPVQCNMDLGYDCTLVAPQQYALLAQATPKLGVKVIGSVHEDVEDPSTIGTPESRAHLLTYERYGMAWIEHWAADDGAAAPWLGGGPAQAEQRAGTITILP